MRARVELLLRQNKLSKQDVKDILEVRGSASCVRHCSFDPGTVVLWHIHVVPQW
jgi:hypothetical protein